MNRTPPTPSFPRRACLVLDTGRDLQRGGANQVGTVKGVVTNERSNVGSELVDVFGTVEGLAAGSARNWRLVVVGAGFEEVELLDA